MEIDVAGLIAGEIGSNRGSQCATCAWLRGRPEQEREDWQEHMGRTTDEVPHASLHRAMKTAAERSGYRAPPSVSSVRKHRTERHP